jgi:hypothetical protein
MPFEVRQVIRAGPRSCTSKAKVFAKHTCPPAPLKLVIGLSTVRTHTKSIYSKLGSITAGRQCGGPKNWD